MAGVEADRQKKEQTANRNEQIKAAAFAVLDALGGMTVREDTLTFEGDKIILPAAYEGRIDLAISDLDKWRRDQAKVHEVTRVFVYRPYDVAAAFERTLRSVFGTSGMGVTRQTMFGPEPPQFMTVPLSLTESIQVPWGLVNLPLLDCTFDVGYTGSEDGIVGRITASAPKRYRARIEGFFVRMEEELRKGSIYKGKAINGAQHPGFIDISVDPKKVVYSDEVMRELEAHVWLSLEYPEAVRAAGLGIKRHVLLEGPFGTGKTLAGLLTAQKAVAAGYTFIQVRPGADNLFEAIKTAKIYAPAVIWFEDLDTKQAGDEEFISKLLEALDGVTAKSGEVMAVFTTNYVENIQKGVMRPGRLDAVIHIGPLDASGYQKLVRAILPEDMVGDIDWNRIAEAFAGYGPAFNVEAIKRTLRYAIMRAEGLATEPISTDDLVNAANGMKRQLELMEGAREGANVPTIDGLLEDLVDSRLQEHHVDGMHIRLVDQD
jgi:hypothetical protein